MIRRLLPLIIALLSFGALDSVHAQAQPFTCASADYDIPQRMILSCASDLLITVVDRDGDLRVGEDWRSNQDFEDDVWVFDHAADGRAELLIDFHREGSALIAELYDQQYEAISDQVKIDYQINGSMVMMGERSFPSVRVVAPDGWWMRGEAINYNLDIFTDGLIIAALLPVNQMERLGVLHDGSSDFTVRIRDVDLDGRPDYDWRTFHLPEQRTPGVQIPPVTYLMVNDADNEAPVAPDFLWSYLGWGDYSYASPTTNTHTPPIQIDWTEGKIRVLNEFVASRSNEGQWFMYSFYELLADQLNVPNFESPFAWYDLAGDQDRRAELAIRSVNFAAGDEFFGRRAFQQPISEIRYSWDQDNNGYWDYKLGLVSSHQIDAQVSLAADDIAIQSVSYDQLPAWVVGRAWDIATFVAVEGVIVSGEGIYEWDVPSWLTSNYFTGMSDTPLPPDEQGNFSLRSLRYNPADEDLAPIEQHFRGEYTFELGEVPRLYFSPIDHRLHLFGAEGGVWNTGDALLYNDDLDGDGYFDHWSYRQNDVQRDLYVSGGYALLNADRTLTLIEIPSNDPLFEIAPPSTHAEWLALESLLAQHRREHTPGDFASMIDPYLETAQRWHDVTLLYVQPTPDGFRAGFVQNETRRLLEADGDGVQTFQGVQPALAVSTIAVNPSSLRALQPAALSLTITNSGNWDLRDLRVRFSIIQNDQSIPIGETALNVNSGEMAQASVLWEAPQAGGWTLHAQVLSEEDEIVQRQLRVEVLEQSPSLTRLINDWIGGLFLLLVIGGGCLFALVSVQMESA
jgi:hypothetical protein